MIQSLKLLPIILMMSLTLFAGVDVRTNIRYVTHQGSMEAVGAMMFEVSGDDFNAANRTNPQYLRISLLNNTALAHTLVGQGGQPINLALSTFDFTGTVSLNAPVDAVSIVRWRSGENEIWLKIVASSSSWLSISGNPAAPNDMNPVGFAVGDSVNNSLNRNQDAFNNGLANLAANTRNSGGIESTTVLADLSGSDLLPGGPMTALMNVDYSTYDHSSDVEGTTATAGNLLPLSMFGDTFVALVSLDAAWNTWMPYVSQGEQLSTNVNLLNKGSFASDAILKAYDTNGNLLESALVSVPANGRAVNAVSDQIGRAHV